jgi:hypothetical protein
MHRSRREGQLAGTTILVRESLAFRHSRRRFLHAFIDNPRSPPFAAERQGNKKPKNTIHPVFESGDELFGALRRLGASLCVLYTEGRFDILVVSGKTMARLKTKLTCPAIQRFNSEAT